MRSILSLSAREGSICLASRHPELAPPGLKQRGPAANAKKSNRSQGYPGREDKTRAIILQESITVHHAKLTALYAAHSGDPSIQHGRQQWSKLLATTLGTSFQNTDDLFVRHTLLVVSAKIIAHTLLGCDVVRQSPKVILSGDLFHRAQIHGAIEKDVFDWIGDIPGGDDVVIDLARLFAEFDWSNVDHDVLKLLYESVIGADVRKQLGEHYTPDWLAYQLIETVVPRPLEQRVLDPACGSGTFLFHAIRRFLQAAENSFWSENETLDKLTSHVFGMDLHPVAATLARVTYLLAIGRERLTSSLRGSLHIPIFLGDSMQWEMDSDPLFAKPRLSAEMSKNLRVDTLVGNPPWLAYRHMPADMQDAFQKMSKARGLWHGAKVATHQDLSALFATRAIELYLEKGGTFGFVMPSAVIDAERQHYRGFRTGNLSHNGHHLHVAFEQPWDLKRLRPHFFPISASVIFGSKQDTPVAMPPGESWTGRLEKPHGTWKDVEHSISRSAATTAPTQGETSPYGDRFRQGATIVPRVLFMVERRKAGPLGHAQGKAAVRSLRSANEKPPWKNLEDREGFVESIFVRPVYTGESVLPFRIRPPAYAVIPRDKQGLMDGSSDRLDQYPELAKWWRDAEATWMKHRSSARLSLMEQLNFRGKLEAQFRIPPLRVLYGRSGMHLAAAYTDDARAVIDNSLYWAAAANIDEARYLCAIMNAAVTTRLVRPLMSYGKDERDIHKSIWRLPIPYFEADDENHVRLVERARTLESEMADADIPDELHFAAARRRLREVIEASTAGREIEAIVGKMLGG